MTVRTLSSVLLSILWTVGMTRTAELKVLRPDSLFRSQYLETFGKVRQERCLMTLVVTAGYTNSSQYPGMMRKYQDFTRLTLPQVLRLPRCANKDQRYAPLRRIPSETVSLLYFISQFPDTDRGPFNQQDVEALVKEAAAMWSFSGVRLSQTREERKADITIRFCQFTECYNKNLTELFDLTGATLDRRGEVFKSFL